MRLALGLEYQGSLFWGWQRQLNKPTIQAALEESLSRVADESITTVCAGRTDAGVHAVGQVVHFDTEKNRTLYAWLMGANTYLPNVISVKWVSPVDDDFHARYSAVSRSYKYVIHNVPRHSALSFQRATWCRYPLDEKRMHIAAQYLLGEQDFSSFRSSECESHTPMRCVQSISVQRQNEFVILEITANAFLHHMVRNIAGVLLRVGANHQSVEWVKDVLLARDRRTAAETAAPAGLYLFEVSYPKPYVFPTSARILFI